MSHATKTRTRLYHRCHHPWRCKLTTSPLYKIENYFAFSFYSFPCEISHAILPNQFSFFNELILKMSKILLKFSIIASRSNVNNAAMVKGPSKYLSLSTTSTSYVVSIIQSKPESLIFKPEYDSINTVLLEEIKF